MIQSMQQFAVGDKVAFCSTIIGTVVKRTDKTIVVEQQSPFDSSTFTKRYRIKTDSKGCESCQPSQGVYYYPAIVMTEEEYQAQQIFERIADSEEIGRFEFNKFPTIEDTMAFLRSINVTLEDASIPRVLEKLDWWNYHTTVKAIKQAAASQAIAA